MTRNQFIADLRTLTVTGKEVSITLTESLGTGTERVNTYNFNALFRTGRNTADKFDVPFYVAGEGTAAEMAFFKGDTALDNVFTSLVSTAVDGTPGVKMFNIIKMDSTKKTAIVQVVREDPQNAGKYLDQWKFVEYANNAWSISDYTGSKEI